MILPWPPSVNTYYRTPSSGRLAGRTMLSAKAREFHELARVFVMRGGPHKAITGRLSVSLEMYPPDRRKRDLDNSLKATLDALQKCGVINDDGDIDALSILRREPVKGGKVKVTIEELT